MRRLNTILCCFAALALLLAAIAGADTYTPYLHLTKPSQGADWRTKFDANFDAIDTALSSAADARAAGDASLYAQLLLLYGDMVARLGSLPEIYVMTGTFNGPTGTVITLPKTVDAVNEYAVAVEPTSRAGAIGDIYVDQGLDNATIACAETNTTDTFRAIIFYREDTNTYGTAIHRKWYVSPLASITNHCNSATEGSLAWVVDQIGAYYATVELPGNHQYDVTDNCTIPENVQIVPQMGAMLNIATGKAITVGSPDQIRAGKEQQIVMGSGKLRFLKPGDIYVDWRGPDKTGSLDVYADLNATFDGARPNSFVHFGSGIYKVQQGLNIGSGGGVSVLGNCSAKAENGFYASTIKAGGTATGTLVTYWPDQPYAGQLEVGCLTLDGNDTSTDGLQVKQSSGVIVHDVVSLDFTERGQWVNGFNDCGYDCYTVYRGYGNFGGPVLFENCFAAQSPKGFSVERRGTPVFSNVAFRNCRTYYTDTGVFVKGDNETAGVYSGLSVSWEGGSLEIGGNDMNATTDAYCNAFRVKDGARLSVKNAYIENYHAHCAGHSYHFWASNDSYVEVSDGNIGLTAWYSRTDDNSTICQLSPGVHEAEPYKMNGTAGPVNKFCVGKNADKKSWGPPNFPLATAPAGGYAAYHGQVFIDSFGTRWLEVEDTGLGGAWGSAIYQTHRWGPMDGRIVIGPITAATLNAGNGLLYWNQANMVVKDLQFVVTTTFTETDAGTCEGLGGHQGIQIGSNSSHKSKFIGYQSNQGDPANLLEGVVVRAWDNNDTSAALSWAGATRKAYYMPGYDTTHITGDWETDHEPSFIAIYPCPSTGYGGAGTWTAGEGYIVMDVEMLEY